MARYFFRFLCQTYILVPIQPVHPWQGWVLQDAEIQHIFGTVLFLGQCGGKCSDHAATRLRKATILYSVFFYREGEEPGSLHFLGFQKKDKRWGPLSTSLRGDLVGQMKVADRWHTRTIHTSHSLQYTGLFQKYQRISGWKNASSRDFAKVLLIILKNCHEVFAF